MPDRLPADTNLPALADAIRVELAAFERDAASAIAHAVRAGELLIEAKAQVAHGEWLPWLAENFPASEATAQRYMQLARNPARVRHLETVRGGLAELATPREPEPVESESGVPSLPMAERIDRLASNLAERVRNGTASIEYAESVMVESGERIEAWAEQIREALHILKSEPDARLPDVLARMVGYPVPHGLAAKLTPDDRDALVDVLDRELANLPKMLPRLRPQDHGWLPRKLLSDAVMAAFRAWCKLEDSVPPTEERRESAIVAAQRLGRLAAGIEARLTTGEIDDELAAMLDAEPEP